MCLATQCYTHSTTTHNYPKQKCTEMGFFAWIILSYFLYREYRNAATVASYRYEATQTHLQKSISSCSSRAKKHCALELNAPFFEYFNVVISVKLKFGKREKIISDDFL